MRIQRAATAVTVVLLLASVGACGGSPSAPSATPIAPTPPPAPIPAPTPAPAPAPAPAPVPGLNVCGVIGTTATTTFGIINGQACAPTGSPVVFIILQETQDGSDSACTGTVIASDAVLTAAHCVTGGVKAVRVIAGAQAVAVASTHPVASFREEDEGSLDVAIVRTVGPLGVAPMPILTSRDAIPGEQAVIAGYGLDDVGADGALKASTMTVSRLNDNFIIMDFTGAGGNTCSGDSGGPLLVQQGGEWVIVGVTSGGTGDESCRGAGTSDFARLRNAEAMSLILGLVPGVAQR